MSILVIETCSEFETLVIGVEGPQGPAGSGTGGTSTNIITRPAATNISAFRPVYIDAGFTISLADSTNLLITSVLGLTNSSVTSGSNVDVIISGEINNTGFGFTTNDLVYLGNGVVTQTPPTAGLLQILGVATSATSFLLEIQQAIKL